MSKYQILCLETFEFLIQREIKVDIRWNKDYPPRTATEVRYYESITIPNDTNIVSYGDPKIAIFLTRKKADIFLKRYCYNINQWGDKLIDRSLKDPRMYEIYSINSKE